MHQILLQLHFGGKGEAARYNNYLFHTRLVHLHQNCTAGLGWHTLHCVSLQEIQHNLGQNEQLCFLSAQLSSGLFVSLLSVFFYTANCIIEAEFLDYH